MAISGDWFGDASGPPIEFGFGLDPEFFHFRVQREAGALMHPEARSGHFLADLWKYDAAEFFLAHHDLSHYLEFNLAPNGAWWSCLFTAPRKRVSPVDTPLPGVIARGSHSEDAWEATASLPIAGLPEEIGFGPQVRLNATCIVDTPHQRFFTATRFGPGEPDFHQPPLFPVVEIRDR